MVKITGLRVVSSAIAIGVALLAAAGVASEARVVAAEPAWSVRLRLVDQALAQKNASAAIYEWREAYGEALRSRSWEALVAVGDAAVRVGDATNSRRGFNANARQAYLAALLRARAAKSAPGLRRIADAFAALGDAEMADRVRYMAGDAR